MSELYKPLHQQSFMIDDTNIAPNDAEIANFLDQLPAWTTINQDGVNKLRACFSFDNYAKTVDFCLAVAELAEEFDHHPSILLEWGKCTVTWWTHTINGLHQADFIMAARTDRLALQL